MSCNLCQKFADILGAEIISNQNGVCVVGFNRDLGIVTILGRRTRSSLACGYL